MKEEKRERESESEREILSAQCRSDFVDLDLVSVHDFCDATQNYK